MADWSGEPVSTLSSCLLQVAGSIPVAARSCDPPHHRGFGDRDVAMGFGECIYEVEGNIRGIWSDNDSIMDPP